MFDVSMMISGIKLKLRNGVLHDISLLSFCTCLTQSYDYKAFSPPIPLVLI
jgi:hypothetical protein